jgi:hypothetical protein
LDLYRQEKVEEGRCTIPCRGGILGGKQCLATSQDLFDTSNLYVYSKILQQLITTSRDNLMANAPYWQELWNMFLERMWLPTKIPQ